MVDPFFVAIITFVSPINCLKSSSRLRICSLNSLKYMGITWGIPMFSCPRSFHLWSFLLRFPDPPPLGKPHVLNGWLLKRITYKLLLNSNFSPAYIFTLAVEEPRPKNMEISFRAVYKNNRRARIQVHLEMYWPYWKQILYCLN